MAVAPRLVVRLTGGREQPPMGAAVWNRTALRLPKGVPGNRFRNVLTGEMLPLTSGPRERELAMGDILALFPVALLELV